MMMMMILHLFQPHQADQMFDPFRILRMQALTNLATPIKSSRHMMACIVCCPWNERDHFSLKHGPCRPG